MKAVPHLYGCCALSEAGEIQCDFLTGDYELVGDASFVDLEVRNLTDTFTNQTVSYQRFPGVCGLDADGAIECYGYLLDEVTPTATSFTAIADGLALDADGRIWSIGDSNSVYHRE